MKPVAIFRHARTEGPGYFATFLSHHGIPSALVKVDQGQPLPQQAKDYSGLVFMGGPMSVNDDLPWIPQTLELIRQAVEREIPVLGHCLGGQLMARALGGEVRKNPVKEIGWGEVKVEDNPAAKSWLGDTPGLFLSFHWHGETFTLPPGAVRILSSPWCENQAFALDRHLGMQCHVEMTPELITSWCETGAREIAAHQGPSVQSAQEMQADLDNRVSQLHRIADVLYSRWIEGLDS
ncbi:MAG TPA: type 1 glutamine amidotransferase [Burkholderiales bacterium]|nr:type 1 glutamine amidotransferase [Burkholderiales bacterium]